MELRARRITQPHKGVYVIDLGQNMVGWARLKVRGTAGDRVRLRFAEVLNPDGTIYTANLRGARCTDTYILSGQGTETWEPRTTFRGFRCVEVTGTPAGMDTIVGIVAHSDMPATGTFACSSALVNQLQHNIVWGQRGNFLEVPTDCPQRDERLGWMGDAQIFARTATYNADVAAFFEKWLVDVSDAQQSGAFTDVSPFVAGGWGTAAWADAGIIIPWALYQAYGDRRVLERQYSSMAAYVRWMEEHSEGLLRPAAGYGDWLAVGAATPTDLLATAYFAHSTDLTAQAAAALGRTADAAEYRALFERIRSAFQHAYIGPDGRLKGNTQTDYVLALAFDLLPLRARATAAGFLAEDIRARKTHLSTGFVGTGHLNPVLSAAGRNDLAYALLLADTYPSWGFSIRQGATTIWERWDGWTPDRGFQDPGMNSFNHYSFGAVGEWLFSHVGGIATDPGAPGFRRILLHPRPGPGLSWARADVDTVRGLVRCDWSKTAQSLRVNVTVPANTSATLAIPVMAGSRITERGRSIDSVPEIRYVGADGEARYFELPSGGYGFVVTNQ
jgi:alpha-L-rhamnosidase